jgi:Flp pilus assembly protein TadG
MVRRLAADRRGISGVEFAIISTVVSVAMLNALDIGRYIYQRMEVQNATQMGAQAAFSTCDTSHLPATTNCTGLTAAVTAAVQSTSLGTAITLKSGSPSEGYYCLNASNALEYVSSVSSKPLDCSSVGNGSLQPVDYVKVETSYTFKAMFPGASMGSAMPATITSTAMMRMQ